MTTNKLEVNAVWGKMMVAVGNKILGYGHDSSEVIEILESYVGDHGQEELESNQVAIYNVVGKPLFGKEHFTLDFSKDDAYFGDPSEGCTDEYEYKVEDTGRKFDDMDSLTDYLKELIKDEEYTIDEVKRFDITQTMVNTIRFDDIEEGDLKVDIEFNEIGAGILDGYHGRRFMLADEVEHYMEGKLEEVVEAEPPVLEPVGMSDEELEAEMAKLEARTFELMKERNYRRNLANLPK